MPVLHGNECRDLPLAIGHQLECDRLHTSGAQTPPHLVPQNGADLVADQPIEHAAGALRVDHLLVDRAGMRERVLNRLFGDLVEGQTMNLALLALELVLDVPADRFAFAVRVGRDVDVSGIFGRVSQLLDDLLARRNRLVLFRKLVLDVHAQLALGQIADVSHRRDDLVVAAQVFVDRLRLRRRLHHDKCFCHLIPSPHSPIPVRR